MMHSLIKKLFLLLSLIMLSACASVPGGPTEGDPFESFNRAMFNFNEGLDEYILKPVAQGYDKAMPEPVKTGVTNVFNNLDDIFVIINDLLQFKLTQFTQDTGRFIINSTFGIFGLFDVATQMGLPKHNEDFGQTFATWGIGKGPYVVLPFFGPRTLRGTGGFIIESIYDPLYNIEDNDAALYGSVALRAIDARYKLLKASNVVEQAALDKYSFIRDAYLQHRKNLIYDGNPPEENVLQAPKATEEDLDLEKALGL